ncbi:hypothetical protein WN943_013492 [Citrus x changshan-huyou]
MVGKLLVIGPVEQLDCCKYSYCSQTNRTGGLDLSEVLCSSEAGNLMLSANPWSQKKKGLKRKVWVFRPSSTNSGSPVVRIASARTWPECHKEPPSRCQIN